MTKKDYVLIATAIAQCVKEVKATDTAKRAVSCMVEHLTHALQIENPKFDPKKFQSFIAKLSRS
jgi:hypothetical protein